MALDRASPARRHVQTVNVNGLYYHSHHLEWQKIEKDGKVVLLRDPSNLHDARAVKVLSLRGTQVGWVPKTANQRIAKLLDEGVQLGANVNSVGSDHLQIDVWAPVEQIGGCKVTPPLYTLGVSDIHGDVSTYRCLRVRTNAQRTSADLVTTDNVKVAWFYKGDDLVNNGDIAIRNGDTWAVVYDNDDALIGIRVDSSKKQCGTVETTLGVTGAEYTTLRTNSLTEKETTMSITDKAVASNKSAATQAAYLEAGRIANNQLVKVSTKALPIMVRGYADTAVGKLVIANIASLAAAQLRPGNTTLAKLTSAMTVAAYQEVYQTIDIEGWLDSLLASPEIKRAIDKLGAEDAKAAD